MTEDEHPNERLVTPSEDGEGFDRSLVSRRSMLGGSALLAGLLAYTSDPTDPQLPGRASGSAAGIARASDNPDEPLIILGPESDPIGYLFQDTAGGIILQDATSGNHFWYNEAQGRWETDAELDVPTLTADGLDIGDSDWLDTGDFRPFFGQAGVYSFSTTSTTYVDIPGSVARLSESWFGSNVQLAAVLNTFVSGTDNADIRLYHRIDDETVLEATNQSGGVKLGPSNYDPTTGSPLTLKIQVRGQDGDSTTVTEPSWAIGGQV